MIAGILSTAMTEFPGPLFDQLLGIMERLRGPGGCPWDREQTRTSLRPYLIEEAYEVLEALEADEAGALREELGDLLLQVVFHAEIAKERGEFTMGDLLTALCDKLVRRHPHVFGDGQLTSSSQVLAQWEAIKQREAAEGGRSRGLLDGLPRALPALLRAQRLQSKAAQVQFDWPDASAAWDKVQEEIAEAAEALATGDRERIREELGDVLFSLVNVARLSQVDAEGALDQAIGKFQRRFKYMECALRARGTSLTDASQDELEQSWEAAKAQERSR